jgi:hypothetical protein
MKQTSKKYYSTEMVCCEDHMMEVRLPETLICTNCKQKYMNLVQGVDRTKIFEKEEK